jgi:hypothetical protein
MERQPMLRINTVKNGHIIKHDQKRFIAISIKISMTFFTEIEKMVFIFICKHRTPIAKKS